MCGAGPVDVARVGPRLNGSIRCCRTVAVNVPVKKRRRMGLWLLVLLLLVIGATAGVAILYPEEFKQTLHLAKGKAETVD